MARHPTNSNPRRAPDQIKDENREADFLRLTSPPLPCTVAAVLLADRSVPDFRLRVLVTRRVLLFAASVVANRSALNPASERAHAWMHSVPKEEGRRVTSERPTVAAGRSSKIPRFGPE